jgi:hypothetical protein
LHVFLLIRSSDQAIPLASGPSSEARRGSGLGKCDSGHHTNDVTGAGVKLDPPKSSLGTGSASTKVASFFTVPMRGHIVRPWYVKYAQSRRSVSMNRFISCWLSLAMLMAISVASRADEKPPVDVKRLLDIVNGLEEMGYTPIVEVSFDDGVWEVEAYKGQAAFELLVNPKTGEVVSEHPDDGDPKPPADALLLSKIIEGLEKAGYSDLNDLSFERQSWEAEATHENERRELRVDPISGKVISDRRDN